MTKVSASDMKLQPYQIAMRDGVLAHHGNVIHGVDAVAPLVKFSVEVDAKNAVPFDDLHFDDSGSINCSSSPVQNAIANTLLHAKEQSLSDPARNSWDGLSVTMSTMDEFDAAHAEAQAVRANAMTQAEFGAVPTAIGPTIQELVDRGVLSPPHTRAGVGRHIEMSWHQQYVQPAPTGVLFNRFVERMSIMLKLCKAVSRGTVDADPRTCTIVVRVPLIRIRAARRALPSISTSSGYVVRVKALSLCEHFTLWKFHSPTEGKL
jgi:hypothetical protein